MVAAESRFAEYHSCIQWKKTDYPFTDIEISRNYQRPRELENWKKKIVQTPRRSDQTQKGRARCCSAALEASGLNWTVKPLVFLISRWRSILLALVFVKFVWRKAVALPWRFVVVDCTSKEQSRTKQQTAVTGWFGSHWAVECSINMFSDEAMARFMFVFIHDFVEFVSTERRRVCSFLQLIPDEWTRREFYICEPDFPTWVHLFLPD